MGNGGEQILNASGARCSVISIEKEGVGGAGKEGAAAYWTCLCCKFELLNYGMFYAYSNLFQFFLLAQCQFSV